MKKACSTVREAQMREMEQRGDLPVLLLPQLGARGGGVGSASGARAAAAAAAPAAAAAAPARRPQRDFRCGP